MKNSSDRGKRIRQAHEDYERRLTLLALRTRSQAIEERIQDRSTEWERHAVAMAEAHALRLLRLQALPGSQLAPRPGDATTGTGTRKTG